MADWKDAICVLPRVVRTSEKSIQQLFEPALAHLDDRAAFRAAITEKLHEHPDLIEGWGQYCTDKRTGRGPYFELKSLASVFLRLLVAWNYGALRG
jgi:hypothetical protein